MTDKLLIPRVHLNGTSKQALLDANGDAIDALQKAGRKLAAAAPNGRDFYVISNDATYAAIAQHEARMNKLREVIKELEQIMLGIDVQGR